MCTHLLTVGSENSEFKWAWVQRPQTKWGKCQASIVAFSKQHCYYLLILARCIVRSIVAFRKQHCYYLLILARFIEKSQIRQWCRVDNTQCAAQWREDSEIDLHRILWSSVVCMCKYVMCMCEFRHMSTTIWQAHVNPAFYLVLSGFAWCCVCQPSWFWIRDSCLCFPSCSKTTGWQMWATLLHCPALCGFWAFQFSCFIHLNHGPQPLK